MQTRRRSNTFGNMEVAWFDGVLEDDDGFEDVGISSTQVIGYAEAAFSMEMSICNTQVIDSQDDIDEIIYKESDLPAVRCVDPYAKRDSKVRRLKDFVVKEISSISESLDTTIHGVVASSRVPIKDNVTHEVVASSRMLGGAEHKASEEVAWQDITGSSTYSLDPLCSIVPCSISGDDATEPEDDRMGKDVHERNLKYFIAPNESPSFKENIVLDSESPLSLKTLAQVGEWYIRKFTTDVPAKSIPGLLNCPRSESLNDGGENHLPEKEDPSFSLPNAYESSKAPCSKDKNLVVLNEEKGLDLEDNVERFGGLLSRSDLKGDNPPLQTFEHEQRFKDQASKSVHADHNVCIVGTRCCGEQQCRCTAQGLLDRRRKRKRDDNYSLQYQSGTTKGKANSTNLDGGKMVFQGLQFMLTGFSVRMARDLEALIVRHGGSILARMPSYSPCARERQNLSYRAVKIPIVICPKKVESTKFLYGCAIDAWILSANWIFDSTDAGYLLPPRRYLIRSFRDAKRCQFGVTDPNFSSNKTLIFESIGFMPYGMASFYSKFSKIVEHGGGQVYKTLEQLIQSFETGMISIGAILVKDENSVPRHLKFFALEHNIKTLPAAWVVDSLVSGKLLPLKKNRFAPLFRIKMPTFTNAHDMVVMSQEI